MRHVAWMLAVLGCALLMQVAAAADDAAPPVKLQYTPKLGDVEQSSFAGKITDVMLAGLQMAEAAKAQGVLKREVVKLDDEKATFTVRAGIKDVSAQVGGEDKAVEPKTVDIVFTRRGEVVKPEDAQDAKPLDDVGGMVQGGLPLDGLAQMAFALVFPADPVAVGGEWTTEGEADLPILGTTTVKSKTKLTKIDEGKAFLETAVSAEVPAFETESPMVGKVKVLGGAVSAEKIERQFDIARSVMVVAKGQLRLEIRADIGFGEVPIQATLHFEMKPVEKTEAKPAE
jgi:hypothetical protein